MTDYTIAIYCFMDDYLQAIGHQQDVRRQVNDAQVLTVTVLSAQYFYGNQHSAFQYVRQHHGMAKLHKSNYNRHLHRLSHTLVSIFIALSRTLKQLNTKSRYLIDSFPVIDLPQGSELYADSAYLNYEVEDLYQECDQLHMLVERKSNSHRQDSAAMRFIKKYYRKRIETTFSEITAHFPAKIHAVTPEGFLLKVVLFIFAFTCSKSFSAT